LRSFCVSLHFSGNTALLPFRTSEDNERFMRNMKTPIKDFSDVQSIVGEIIDEGEGKSDFAEKIETFLEHVSQPVQARVH